jgi:signal transduction histidine kinase
MNAARIDRLDLARPRGLDLRENGGGGIERRATLLHQTHQILGMGMGLAICRSIIEAHRGRLWATRDDDQGTTFRF